MSEALSSQKTIVGKNPGSPAILEVSYDAALLAVDELIQPPDVSEFLAPGFIDLQVNGFAGVDYNDPATAHEAIAQSIRAMFETGVTRFFPTLITGSEERIVGALRNLVAAKSGFAAARRPEAQAMAGIHVEGPHISSEDGPRGAHPLEHVRPPD